MRPCRGTSSSRSGRQYGSSSWRGALAVELSDAATSTGPSHRLRRSGLEIEELESQTSRDLSLSPTYLGRARNTT
jgi:hypothetical protein